MSTEQAEQAVNPQQLAKQLAKEQRKAKAAVELAERKKEKEEKKQANLEATRIAHESKLLKKQAQAEKMALLEQTMIEKREASRVAKELNLASNLEKMRVQQEAKKEKTIERQAKHAEQQKIEDENARQRAETTVLVTLDQQALLDQIRLVAEKSGVDTKVAKLSLISVGNTSQVKLVFENAEQATSFLASKPEKNDLLVKMENARPLAGAKRTCFFSFEHEPHGDRPTATAAVIAALKKSKMKFTHGVLRGGLFVIEFASEQEADKACKALVKGGCGVGSGKARVVIGVDALVGNPPKRPNKKRNLSAMQE